MHTILSYSPYYSPIICIMKVSICTDLYCTSNDIKTSKASEANTAMPANTDC